MDELTQAFVEAADRLVNLLATTAIDTVQGREVHEASLREAMDAYDRARRDLTGEDISSI